MKLPTRESLAARRRAVVGTAMLGTVATVLAATIVNVAFPALMQEFRVGHDTLQWISTGFLAATTATMLATTWLVQRFGQRRTFVATMAAFLLGSALGAASPTIDVLIAARVLQGAAAGIMQPLGMIMLFDVFPVERRGTAMGMFGVGIVLAPAIGPSVGGVLIESFGWRSIFLLSIPFCLAAIPLGLNCLRRARGARPGRFDWMGFLLLVAGLVALLDVPVVGHRNGWASLAVTAIAVTAFGLLAAFVAWEFRAPAPMLALRLFAHRGFSAAALVAFAYGVGLFGSTYLVPVFVQDIAGYTPAEAGTLLLWPGLALAGAIAVAGRLTDRHEPRRIVALGLFLFALSSLVFAFGTAITPFWLLAAYLMVGRIGLGMIIPSLNVGAVQALDPQYLAFAAAAVNFVRQLGGAVGVNLLAVLLEWRLVRYGSAAGTLAFRDCFLVVTMAFAVAIVPALAIRAYAEPH